MGFRIHVFPPLEIYHLGDNGVRERIQNVLFFSVSLWHGPTTVQILCLPSYELFRLSRK